MRLAELLLNKDEIVDQIIESEKWLKTTLNSFDEGVIATDTSGKIRLMNSGAEKLTEWSKAEAFQKYIHEVCNLQDEHTRLPWFDSLPILDPLYRQSCCILVSKSGEEIHVFGNISPIFDQQQTVIGQVLVIRDVSDNRPVQLALSATDSDLHSFIDDLNMGVFRISFTDKQFVRANTALARILGYASPEELKKKHISDIFPHPFPQDLFRPAAQIKQELKLITRNGDQRWVSCTARAQNDGSGRLQFVDGIMEDIHERKLSEEEQSLNYQKLQRTMQGAIQTITQMLEIRDPYTAGHQRGVTNLACAIAAEMGLTDEQITGIRMSALIHDIGKIYIPSEVLCKPGNLSDIEYDLMKTHPEIGSKILSNIEFSHPVSKVVYQHHERLDGSGYPNGIKGNEIMIEARILGVADIVEAMASHRPYRAALGIDLALGEVISKRGIKYDPRVVDACVVLFREKGFTFDKDEFAYY